MVRALGGWIGLDWVDPSLPDALQRRIVREYFSLLRWRGTRRGMRQLLELISDGAGDRRGDRRHLPRGRGAAPTPATCVLRVESSGWATEADLLRIVRAELPASVTFELFVGDRRIWPPTPTPTNRTVSRSWRRSPDGRDRVPGVRSGHVAAGDPPRPPTSSARTATTRCSGRRRRCRSRARWRRATPRCGGCPAPAGGC